MTIIAILLFIALIAIAVEVVRAHRTHTDALSIVHGDLSRDIAEVKAELAKLTDKPQ